jgi:phage gpG-like protein
MLVSSIRITSLDPRSVSIGSDRKYAAIHQLGGVIKAKGKALVFMLGGKKIFAKQVKIPARPFFPFTKDGTLIPIAAAKVGKVIDAAVRKLLRA